MIRRKSQQESGRRRPAFLALARRTVFLWLRRGLSLVGMAGVFGSSLPAAPLGPAIVPGQQLQHQFTPTPILMQHCWACHGGSAQEGGLDLRTWTSVRRGGRSGPAVLPGQPEKSLLLRRIRDGQCPPNQRLVEANVKPVPARSVEKLVEWIAAGAPEEPETPDVAGTRDDPLVTPKDRGFWSFQRLAPVTPPTVANPNRARNPVDAFILEKLAEQHLDFAPEASPAVLVRRVYFDLLGLPPTPEETAAFVADPAPDAFERLVDRLLASPRYGERWGRYWLDVAGYAEVEGKREQHLPRPHMYRYRDYVIRSFNADKPYDQFLTEQLAGDELADLETATEITPAMADNLVATAFLRQAPDPTWANITGFIPDRVEVIGDAMDVLGSGVLGLTLKCARCHDHKFDPLPQRDYYRLLDIFKGALDEYNWMKPDLRPFGGAGNSGNLPERTLPFVSTAERQAWAAERDRTSARSPAEKASLPPEPRVAALWDRGQPSPTYIYARGDYQRPGQRVTAGVPAVLSKPDEPFDIRPPWPGARKTGRRLAFARWLTQADHPLTSRVLVNRLWKHHFGRGLVRTLDNFGHTGAAPTHPQLLDWLAGEFVRGGWRMKSVHRLLVTSTTYRQSSQPTAEGLKADPDNVRWSRRSMQRLDAEALWDTCVSVADARDDTPFGPAIPVAGRADGSVAPGRYGDRWRRSIYGQQTRKEIPTLLEVFDLPPMNPNCVQRGESNVATQALQLMNDPLVRELAGRFAARVVREAGETREARIGRAFQIAFAREPSAAEFDACGQLWRECGVPSTGATAAEEVLGLRTLCHLLMNSAEFIHID